MKEYLEASFSKFIFNLTMKHLLLSVHQVFLIVLIDFLNLFAVPLIMRGSLVRTGESSTETARGMEHAPSPVKSSLGPQLPTLLQSK